MQSGTSKFVAEKPCIVPSQSGFARCSAILEVTFGFALVHVAYRFLKYCTVLGEWDSQTNFIPGLVMTAFTISVLLLCRRSFAAYGVGVERWSYQLNLGLACSLVLLLVVALGLVITRFQFDASKPPDPHAPFQYLRVAGLAAVVLPAFILVLWLVAKEHAMIQRIPVVVTIPAICALIALLPLAAAHYHRPPMWRSALWLFLGAGFGEEIFFRGYIQSRLDQAFGFPFRWLGFEFGPGLFFSSLFFGLIHALNTVDYFHGRFDFGWWHGLQNIFTGLFFGLIRARTGSILPGAVLHGLQDVFARIPSLLP
jgi:membrane protease YdiL (CAAX protease family)